MSETKPNEVLLLLKIQRSIYQITEKDKFMDNGACVQLLTQSNIYGTFGGRPSPVLSKRAIKEISAFDRSIVASESDTRTKVFHLLPKEGGI